jgi:hypothetical protein
MSGQITAHGTAMIKSVADQPIIEREITAHPVTVLRRLQGTLHGFQTITLKALYARYVSFLPLGFATTS